MHTTDPTLCPSFLCFCCCVARSFIVCTLICIARSLICLARPLLSVAQRSSVGRDAWPRAAWYVRGVGRHAADGLSEAPVIRPLVPLGDFIQRVGLRPAPDALHTYLQRLREHGFDVAATVDKVRGAGVALVAEVAAITRLEGGEDRDAIGKVRAGVPHIWGGFSFVSLMLLYSIVLRTVDYVC